MYKKVTEGPLGFPVTDQQAIALAEVLKTVPKDDAHAYRKAVFAKGPTEVMPGERSDVSWISTEDPDRCREVVLSKGMNDTHFKLNPIVTMDHAYYLPPIGKSVWRKVVKDGAMRGIKAKTVYPVKPEGWPEGKDWGPDVAFALIQADLLRGKSIGFLPTKVFEPDEKTCERNGWGKVDLVIEEWLLLEYACTFLPMQQNAMVEAVSKSALALPPEFIKAMGIEPQLLTPAPEPVIPTVKHFTPLSEIEGAIAKRMAKLDLTEMAKKATELALAKATGRI